MRLLSAPQSKQIEAAPPGRKLSRGRSVVAPSLPSLALDGENDHAQALRESTEP